MITEMDKIGGDGINGRGAGFYTSNDWGQADLANIWSAETAGAIQEKIDFYLLSPGKVWGSDDDTDIEYLYQHLLYAHKTCILTPEQIRAGRAHHRQVKGSPSRFHVKRLWEL